MQKVLIMNSQNIGQLEVVNLSDVTPKEVKFLIKPQIPLGKITLVSGDPEAGKTWLMCAIASAISNGKDPFNNKHIEPSKVLIMTAEDGLADTIVVRLKGLDADMDQIQAVKSLFSFSEEGLFNLELVVEECKPKALFIDPLFAYFDPKVDIHKANHTRSIMKELARLSEDYECAIVGIRHLTKGERRKAIHQGIGSIDLSAACRSELLVGVDPNDPEIHGIVHIKSNLAPKGNSIGYKLKEDKFEWVRNCDLTAEDMLAVENRDDPTAMHMAIDFLKKLLSDGRKYTTEILSQAKDNGITDGTLRRAKNRLKIEVDKEKISNGKWYWQLPSEENSETEISDKEIEEILETEAVREAGEIPSDKVPM